LQVEGLVPISFTLKDGRYSTFLTGAEGKSFSLTSDSTSPLYVTLQSEGVPLKPSIETANYGVSLEVEWLDDDGMKISPESLKQGTTFWGHYSVAKSYGEEINELALTAVLPSGWEIENLRVTGENRPEWMEKLVMGKEEYTDIRDDRINWYFDMPRRYRYGSRRNKFDFCVKINVTYSGEFQLPAASLDAMYNPEYFARIAGKKVVVKR